MACSAEWLAQGLQQIGDNLTDYLSDRRNETGVEGARKLAPMYRQDAGTLHARQKFRSRRGIQSNLRIGAGRENLNSSSQRFKQLLGLDMLAPTTVGGGDRGGIGGARVGDETARSVTPGEEFRVRVHATQALGAAQLTRVWLDTQTGTPWKAQETGGAIDPQAAVTDRIFNVHVAEDAAPTAPFNTRPSIEQPYYDISNEAWRERSFAPWPLAAWVEFTFDGLPIRIGNVVQTLQRVTGIGGIYQPLVVTPNHWRSHGTRSAHSSARGIRTAGQSDGACYARCVRNRYAESAGRLARITIRSTVQIECRR